MITLPPFKASIVQVGGSKGLRVPAKILQDYEVSDEEKYWVEIRLLQEGDA